MILQLSTGRTRDCRYQAHLSDVDATAVSTVTSSGVISSRSECDEIGVVEVAVGAGFEIAFSSSADSGTSVTSIAVTLSVGVIARVGSEIVSCSRTVVGNLHRHYVIARSSLEQLLQSFLSFHPTP